LITAAAEQASTRDDNTRDAIERGIFGAPSYVLGKEIFWGQDRLEYLDDAITALK
jgi:2-hydroxychromene-2-carboxylate isomerase